jgi:hypothetical protein
LGDQLVRRVVIMLAPRDFSRVSRVTEPANSGVDAQRHIEVDVGADPERGVLERRDAIDSAVVVRYRPRGTVLRATLDVPGQGFQVPSSEFGDQARDVGRFEEEPRAAADLPFDDVGKHQIEVRKYRPRVTLLA